MACVIIWSLHDFFFITMLQEYKVVLHVADVGQGTAILIEVQETSVQNGASFINVILN